MLNGLYIIKEVGSILSHMDSLMLSILKYLGNILSLFFFQRVGAMYKNNKITNTLNSLFSLFKTNSHGYITH